LASNDIEAQGKLLKDELGKASHSVFAWVTIPEAAGAEQVYDKLETSSLLDKRHK
jgi:hypothetical protein